MSVSLNLLSKMVYGTWL